MELSELLKYQGRLYTCDDRSGILFEVVGYDPELPDGPKPVAYPRHIMMEGSGDTDKGFKCEWMAQKDGLMMVGSFGKEYTDNDGNILNSNNLWVKVFTPDGRLSHVDWTSNYEAMRRFMGYSHPAYLLHETALWSPQRQQWVFLPRRMSHEPYDDKVDERKGANTVITASRDFSVIDSFSVGTLTPERGFSSAKFVPGGGEKVVVALKSEENAEAGTQGSYITVFDMDGQVLMEEIPIPGAHKYEGIEFL